MNRRQLLAALSCLPFCGWMKPKEPEFWIDEQLTGEWSVEGCGEWHTRDYKQWTRCDFYFHKSRVHRLLFVRGVIPDDLGIYDAAIDATLVGMSCSNDSFKRDEQ